MTCTCHSWGPPTPARNNTRKKKKRTTKFQAQLLLRFTVLCSIQRFHAQFTSGFEPDTTHLELFSERTSFFLNIIWLLRIKKLNRRGSYVPIVFSQLKNPKWISYRQLPLIRGKEELDEINPKTGKSFLILFILKVDSNVLCRGCRGNGYERQLSARDKESG